MYTINFIEAIYIILSIHIEYRHIHVSESFDELLVRKWIDDNINECEIEEIRTFLLNYSNESKFIFLNNSNSFELIYLRGKKRAR